MLYNLKPLTFWAMLYACVSSYTYLSYLSNVHPKLSKLHTYLTRAETENPPLWFTEQ